VVEHQAPIIAFVWRPEEIIPPVIQMAHRTGSRAIFDVSTLGVEALRPFLRQTDPAGHVRDIKISVSTLMDPALGPWLQETGVQDIWVECHPQFSPGDPAAVLERLRQLSEDHRCFPIIGDLNLLAAVVKDSSGIGRLVLKGCEASGFVSAETTLALYAAVKEMRPTASASLDILIWGGVATPEAAAAFLATGAAGIVFESLHWLTDLVAIDDGQRQRLLRLRLDSTDLVGLDLGVPCRLFNKGNSLAFKEIKAFENSQCGAEITEASRRAFASRVQAGALHPLASRFSPDEVIPLGVEATFAASFVERFGAGTEGAVQACMDEIRHACRLAETKKDAWMDSPVAQEMGTLYPFIQGAMSWITEVPEFAAMVADAGGLPTIALGLMDAAALDRRLGGLPEIMGGRPYAVNVVSLAENPYRQTQLAWIKQHRPRFVVIAGGNLSFARELLECSLEVMYIAPDEALMRLALEAGVRYVICEGYEAGGHVGPHSTLTLAQMALNLKRRHPSLGQNCRLILAGGIFNRETAFIAAGLGADAIQMGTAYLATQEIVETRALTALYQQMILESPPGETVVSGQETGLRVRSLRTPRTAAILSLEREFAAGRTDEAAFRTKIEEMTAGSLFAAARGLDRPGGAPLSEQACRERGQFMSGACAGGIRKVRKLTSFHRELAAGPLKLHQPFAGATDSISPSPSGPGLAGETPSFEVGHGLPRGTPRRDAPDRVAITGMSLVNALGQSPEEVWAASLAMKSGITPVPASRWDHGLYYDPHPFVPDKTYCKVGAFTDLQISRTELGIPPHDFRTMTESTRITMWLADQAIRTSGLLASDIPRERIGVLISQNSGEAAGSLAGIIIRANICHILADIKRAVPLTPDQESAIAQEMKSGRLAPDDTTLLGRLNCAAAGFICNRYGFMGPSYSVSAACATSLVALYSAIQMIKNGIIDAAVVGGAEEILKPLHFLEFSGLGALFGLSGQERPAPETSRPFDAQREGMVLGEGGGIIVIERESLARARGAPVHAVITGMGASNNVLGMVESSSVSQEMAIRASFQGLPYGPDAVDLVECHATSTRQGDVEEARALKACFNGARRTVITSFKSQIGHTLGASGINSLIRGVMAMQAEVFPPTLNYLYPDPEIALERSGLIIATEPLTWESRNGRPRRLQVNAFGFGGSNYVVQVEQAMDAADTVLVAPSREPGLGAPAPQGVSFFKTEMDGHNWRMAVVAESEAEALTVIERSAPLAGGGKVSPEALRSWARQGIFLGREDQPVLPLALVFPGQGSHYAGMGRELYESFPVIKEWMDRAAAAADFDLLHLLFHDQEENLQKTRWQQPALFTVEYAVARYLMALGIHPVAMAGHSLGELTALCLAGVYSLEDGFRIVNQRALCMDKAATMGLDPGVMAAVDAPLDLLQEMIKGQEQVYISNINSPNQIVLSGKTEPVKNFGNRLKEMGYRATLLRVSMAFHSPIMRVIRDELEAFIAPIPFHAPQIPVISNTTMAPFPADPGEIKRILMAHLESTVHWMPNVQTLWNDYGIRLFTEVGPGDILSNLIYDTLPEPACIQTCLPEAESLTCKSALAQLFTQGQLPPRREPRFVSLPGFGKAAASPRTAPAPGLRPPEPGPAGFKPVERIIQREINRFVMETYGRFFEPNILAAVRQEHDPTFQAGDLAAVIQSMLQGSGPPEGKPPISLREPAAPPPEPYPAIPEPASPAADEAPGDQDHLEMLIHIIMDATGFNRDEIEPDMDLRRDLSIRSSRLPIIMDAAERQFGITIELEDFIHVRTVKDIADRISEIINRQEGDGLKPVAPAVDPGPGQAEILTPSPDEASLKRLVFHQAPVLPAASMPMELSPGDSVLLLSPDRDDRLAGRVGDILRLDYGVKTHPLLFMPWNLGPNVAGYDLLTDAGALRAAESISGLASLAGMVITLPQGESARLRDMAEAARLLRGLFGVLQAFLQSPAKKFVVLIHSREDTDTLSGLPAEGMLGLFLSAAQEYPSVQFRTLAIDPDTDLRAALGGALDRGCPVVEMMHREGRVFTSEGRVAPSVFNGPASLNLRPGDVIVMSGGAAGITAHLARSLSPFRLRLVFLGRTPLNPGINPGTSPRAVEMAQTLADLHAAGIEAAYHICDVTNPEAVRTVLGQVASRYGRIDGIIHGAGVLRDGLLSQLTGDDLSMVTEVKFLGAWNLFSAAEGAGLRFFVGLSSGAMILGNPGQSNYAAANRMMSALLRYLGRKNRAIRFKALMLPPIEGAGMADDPAVRELMRRKGVAYVQVNELAGLFCRELSVAPAGDDWVMFMRTLPAVKTAQLNAAITPALEGDLAGGAVAFSPEDFPLIDRISSVDLRREQLEAFRTFSPERDLWLEDHRPLKSAANPLVSAAMVLETFMEAARLLYPHLEVRGVRQVRFLDMIECPPGAPRTAKISCRRADPYLREVWCEVSLSTPAISPTGRLTDRFTPDCQGQVSLDGGGGDLGEELTDFPVRLDELREPPMDQAQVLAWYEDRSGLKGRYRVIELFDGAGPGVARGRTTYREAGDFAHLRNARYQYSPYLFEALMQLAYFAIVAMDPAERRSMLPVEIGEMRFLRPCRVGEQITVEARRRVQDEAGQTWDARGLDDQGRPLMQVWGMRMHWVSE
jgi:malonyl CoA-acyl carrier protein transacylase